MSINVQFSHGFERIPQQGYLRTFSRLVNWASEASPTLGCSIEISRDIYIMSVCMSVVCQITWNHVNQTRACSKSVLGDQ